MHGRAPQSAEPSGTDIREPRRVVASRGRDRDYALRRALLAGDLLAVTVSFSVLQLLAFGGDAWPEIAWFSLTLPAWALCFRAYQLYGSTVSNFGLMSLDNASRLFHALLVGSLLLFGYFELVPVIQLEVWFTALFWVLALSLATMTRFTVRSVFRRTRPPERIVVVAEESALAVLHRILSNHPEYEMEMIGAVTESGGDFSKTLPLELAPADLESLVLDRRIDHLIVQHGLSFVNEERLAELMRTCFENRVAYSTFPEHGTLLPGFRLRYLEGWGLLSHEPPVLSRSSRILKRSFDLVVSAILLLIVSPLLVAIAVLIKVDSKGPVLFRQKRVGWHGRPFKVIKFRTMRPDAEDLTDKLMESSSDPNWLLLEVDPRVTRVGAVLRSFSLDELPQLWNVLVGEMSMVGPRPLSVLDNRGLEGWERRREDLMPGLTGEWQVMGRTSIPFQEMIAIDYAYVTSWSMWRDLGILVRTISALLRRHGSN